MFNPKREVFYTMSSSDLEEIVEGEFGRSWSFVASEEMSNDSLKVIYVGTNGMDEGDEIQYSSANDIMGELAKRKIIPTGKYLIDVSW